MGAVSGGFIPPLCPLAPSPSQVAALEKAAPGGAEATAAKIKASEADAKARVAAVEYLGTVDCTRWKEATLALVSSLRADPNECVRYAAARVLNSGCCCNKATIEALRICVAGEDKDGNPPETSPRVKAAAFNALQNCLVKVPEVLPEEEVKPIPLQRERGAVPELEPLPNQKPLSRERSTMNDGKDTHVATSLTVSPAPAPGFDSHLRHKTLTQTVNDARQTLFDVSKTAKPPATLPPGRRSVFDAFVKARRDIDSRNATPAQAARPADPGVVPSSYVPGADPATGNSATDEPQGPMSSSLPGSTPEGGRGLFGLLFQARAQQPRQ
jgi:hypothetical protein